MVCINHPLTLPTNSNTVEMMSSAPDMHPFPEQVMEKQYSPDISSHISHSALTHLYLRHSSLLSSGGCRTRFTSSSKISGLIKLRHQVKSK